MLTQQNFKPHPTSRVAWAADTKWDLKQHEKGPILFGLLGNSLKSDYISLNLWKCLEKLS